MRTAADLVLRPGPVERFAVGAAARRGRGLALLWHRIGPQGPAPHEVVPTLATAAFEAQLDLLVELGDVVPLTELDGPRPSHRPRFALTFDDDDAGHAAHALPALVARRLPATFFLSGRWCHGYGRYWWELLEDELRRDGPGALARRHGLDPGLAAPGIGQALTGTEAAAGLAEAAQRESRPPMSHDQAAALVAAGMGIGFHTVDHEVLPGLDDAAQRRAITEGRDVLADDLGTAVSAFAYPHGRSDERAERTAAAAGYRSAWTTGKHVVDAAAAPMRLGRWDVGHLPLPRARATIVRGLARPKR